MKFVDGSAFLDHYFVKLGWLSSWTGLFEDRDKQKVFSELEFALNQYAQKKGCLNLSIPMAFIEGEKAL